MRYSRLRSRLESLDSRGLLRALGHMIPNFVGFVISFFVIGAYWAAHRRAFRWVLRVDEKLVWRNLRLLMFIAFLPFPTAVISEYALVPAAVVFYLSVLAVATLAQLSLWRYALRNPAIVSADAPPAEIRSYFRRAWFLFAATVLAGALCLLAPRLPVLAYMVLPSIAVWLATFGPVQRLAERLHFRRNPLRLAADESTPPT